MAKYHSQNLQIYRAHCNRLRIREDPDILKSIEEFSKDSTILWFGLLHDLGYLRDAVLRRGPMFNAFHEKELGIWQNGKYALFLLSARRGFDLADTFLHYHAKYSDTISYYVPADFPLRRLFNLTKYVHTPLHPLLSLYGNYFLLGSVDMPPEDLHLLYERGLYRVPLHTHDPKVAVFASYLLADATNYRYDVFVQGNYLYLGACSLEAFYLLQDRFASYVEDVIQSRATFHRVKDFAEAAAYAYVYAYKGCVVDDEFYVVLPYHQALPAPPVEEFRKELLAHAETCPFAQDTDIRGWSIFSLTLVYYGGDACFTPEELSRKDFYPEILRDYRIWHFYVALGHTPPESIDPLPLELHEHITIAQKPVYVYYYISSTGTPIPVAFTYTPNKDKYTQLLQEGYFFSRLALNLYLEKGVLIEDTPPHLIDETNGNMARNGAIVSHLSTRAGSRSLSPPEGD